MTVRDGFKQLTVEEFKGLLTTKALQDCALDYAPVANNVAFTTGRVGSRPGTSRFLDLGATITDIYHSEFLLFNTTRFYLILAQNHKLYYVTDAGGPAVELYSPSGNPTMFKVAVYGNLVFIFFSDASASTYGVCAPVVWDPSKLPTIQVDIFTIKPEPNVTAFCTGTLTSDTTNPDPGDTVTITASSFGTFGPYSWVYTFVSALTGDVGSPGEVLIGATASDTLANLKAAINLDAAGVGSQYGKGTVAAYVMFEATTKTATTLVVQARQSGASQTLGTTVSSAHLSWGGANLSGGSKLDAADGTQGDCAGGYHAIRVLFKTRTGYISSPSDARVCLIRQGQSTLPVSGIPVYTGATGHSAAECVSRILIMTEAFGDVSDIDTLLDPLYFNAALNGSYYKALEIADNSTTSGTINISDEKLRAEEKFDNAFQYTSPVPFFSTGKVYKNRLIASGNSSSPSLAYVSELGTPQTFRADVGFLDVNREDGTTVVTSFQMRDVLYILKGLGIYATQDNGQTPDTWSLMRISEDVGTATLNGVSESSDEDFVVILDFRGMYYFNGAPPEKASKGIQPTWDKINIAAMATSEIHIDTVKRRVHCLVPTREGLTVYLQPSRDFVFDYQDGWGDKGRWSEWYPQTRSWRSMMIDTGGYRVITAQDSRYLQAFGDTLKDDDSVAIDYKYLMGLAQYGQAGIGLFEGIDLHLTGTGTLAIKVYGPDGTLITTPTAITMASTPNKDNYRGWNVPAERILVEFSHNAAATQSTISRATIFVADDGVRAY